VVLAGRTAAQLEESAEAIRAAGGEALAVPTDVADASSVQHLVDACLSHFGRFDVLVNNAGGSHSYAFEDWNADRFQNMIDLNLKSAFVLSQRVAPHMVERGSGSIVNISSGAAVAALPIHTAYGAAKAGLENLTQNFAAALAPHGVRVNCVRVGAIKSEGFLRAMGAAGIDPDEMGGRAAGLGRAGVPEEIAWPVLFLASAASSYVSGQTLYVGGGPKDITA